MLTGGILLFLAAFSHAAPDPGFFDSVEAGKPTIQGAGKHPAIVRIGARFIDGSLEDMYIAGGFSAHLDPAILKVLGRLTGPYRSFPGVFDTP